MLLKTMIPITLMAGLLLIAPLAGANQDQEIQVGIDGKTSGEVIAVKYDWQIAKWCNFDKNIAVGHKYILCVYNGR